MADGQGDSENRREANVLLELRMAEPITEEVLDSCSDDVLATLEERASGVALGPAVALNPNTSTIKLRFDVLGADNAEIHRQVSEVLTIIERDTHLIFARSSVAA